MALVINDKDKLNFIITEYGLDRIAEALDDPFVRLKIDKVKVGDANGEFYEPDESQTKLVNEIPGGEFYIIKKQLLEDNLTISLHVVFPEKFDNCEIREIGLYESTLEGDKLFAIGTQQPLLKPSSSLNYIISVDYYLFLKSQNLADVYDQIVLDPLNQMVTEEDLLDLMDTILFTDTNLMNQIKSNTEIIGLDRVQQLYERMEKETESYSYKATYDVYTSLLNFVKAEDIFGYWVFNYPRIREANASITDISKSGRNLSSDLPVTGYARDTEGFTSLLSFAEGNHYYINQSARESFDLVTFSKIGNPVISSGGLAQNFSSADYFITANDFESGMTIRETLDVSINGNSEDRNQKMFGLTSTSGEDNITVIFNKAGDKRVTLSSDGKLFADIASTPITESGTYKIDFSIAFEEGKVRLRIQKSDGADVFNKIVNTTNTLKAGTQLVGFFGATPADPDNYFNDGSINLRSLNITIDDENVASGLGYQVENDMSLLTEDKSKDIPFSMIFVVKPLKPEIDRTLLARSNYATGNHVFEIYETGNGELVVKLFADSSNYIEFKSFENKVPDTAHTVIISYDGNKNLLAYVNGIGLELTTTKVGKYEHMNASLSTLYSFSHVPTYIGYADDSTSPEEILNADGSPYTGSDWMCDKNVVYYKGLKATLNQDYNTVTDRMYAWSYDDGSVIYIVYTKSEIIDERTKLFNANYSRYEGTHFKVVRRSDSFIVQFDGQDVRRDSDYDKEPRTVYGYCFMESLQTVWANDYRKPTVLYLANGDLYPDTDWSIVDGKVKYKDGATVEYDSRYDITVPALPVTSYVTDINGLKSKGVMSQVGIVSVIKSKLEDDEMRTISLELEAALGKNPCLIRTY